MFQRLQIKSTLFAGGLAVALATSAVWLPGCGGEEKAAAPAAPEAAAPAAAADAEAVPAGSAAKTASAVATGDLGASANVLRWRPESAATVILIPSVAGLEEKLVPLVQRFAPDMNVEEELAAAVSDLAMDAGVDADTVAGLAEAKGLNANAPLGIFLHIEEAQAAATPSEGEDGATVAVESEPDMLLVLPVSDAEKATALVSELADAMPETAGLETSDEEYAGTTLKVLDPEQLAYFVSGDQLILSNRLDFLKQAADRIATPAATNADTGDLAADDAELIALVYGGPFMQNLSGALSAFGAGDPQAQAMLGMMGGMADIYETDGAPEPIVTTLDITEEEVVLASRVDYAKYPKLEAFTGKATPMRLATKLPQTTQALLSYRLTPEFKANLVNQVLPGVAGMAEDPGAAMAVPIVMQVLELVGDEISLGIAPVDGDFPALMLMIGLKDAAMTKSLLSMYAQPVPLETYRDVEISALSGLPIPVQLSLAFAGDTLLLSNNQDEIKGLIDRLQDGADSELFASISPALPAETPRYAALYIDTKLVSDVIVPLASLTGALEGDAGEITNLVTDNVSQVRQVQEMDGTWQETSFHVYLKPAEAAPADAAAESGTGS